MQAEKVAELATQVVSSTLQSGKLPLDSAEKVCEYYAKVYTCIAECSDAHNSAILASGPEMP